MESLSSLLSFDENSRHRYLDLVIGLVFFRLAIYLAETWNQASFESSLKSIKEYLFPPKPEHRGQIDFPFEDVLSHSRSKTERYDLPSVQLQAVLQKVTQLTDGRVRLLRECQLTSHFEQVMFNKNTGEFESRWDGYQGVYYEVAQEEPFELIDDIYVKVEESERTLEAKGEEERIVSRNIMVYSDKYAATQLLDLLMQWGKEFEEAEKSRLLEQQMIFQIRFDKEGDEHTQICPFHTFRDFSNYDFEHKDFALNEIDFFINNKDWYEERGLPYTLGILCHGEPGCGKTSFIKALLQHTRRHAIVISINGFTNLETLDKIMNGDTIANCPLPQDKRIYILEDIDAMGDLVKRRDWKSSEGRGDGSSKKDERDTAAAAALTLMLPKTKLKKDLQGDRSKNQGKFDKKEDEEELKEEDLLKLLLPGKRGSQHLSYLLNILDGVVEMPGRIIVMTTNFVESLDPALTRPGRIDLKMEFRRCTREMICVMLSRFYEVPLESIVLPDEIPDRALTPARVAQVCRGAKRSLSAAIPALVLAVGEDQSKKNENEDCRSDREFPAPEKERWTHEPVCTDPELACFDCKTRGVVGGSNSNEEDEGGRIEVNIDHHHIYHPPTKPKESSSSSTLQLPVKK